MKNSLFSFLFLLAFLGSSDQLSASDGWFSCSGISVEGRVAAFFPESPTLRSTYASTGWPEWQLRVNKDFCDSWQVWGEIDWFSKSGRLFEGRHDKTTLRLATLSFGGNYILHFLPCIDVYMGGGLCWNFVNFKSHSHHGDHHHDFSKSVAGIVLKSGIYYYFYDGFFADFFLDYMYQPFHRHCRHSFSSDVERHPIPNLKAFSGGAGLGYKF